MKCVFFTLFISAFFLGQSQGIYIDDLNTQSTVYVIKNDDTTKLYKGDTLYHTITLPANKKIKSYAVIKKDFFKDSILFDVNFYDSATNQLLPSYASSESRKEYFIKSLKRLNGGKTYLVNIVIIKNSIVINPNATAKVQIKQFNVNRFMTGCDIGFDVLSNRESNMPWTITNASGREVATGNLTAHAPSESFTISVNQLKAGRYTFTLGEGSESINENFSIY